MNDDQPDDSTPNDDRSRLTSAVPIVPAGDIEASAAWYRDALGFAVYHTESEYGIVGRDDVYLHLWGPSGIAPHDSMTMFRLGVRGIDGMYAHCSALDIVHPNAPLETKPWGSREFAVIDLDGNLVTFFEFPADHRPEPQP
jgi:catechol 2,3-dioxygenase-like lactoylglutathione lyase family enzyme